MKEITKKFKSSPKRFHPRGLEVLYEDNDIVVVNKINGLLTIATNKIKENTAYYLLSNYVKKGNPKSKKRVFIVHRLDRDTSGVIVFAKTEKAKYFLQENWKQFKKKYFALSKGILPKKQGVIMSYLAENSIHKMYSTDDPKKGKLAKTGYKLLKKSQKYSLVEVDLITGRKNQIRVHFSDLHCPILGDKIYGQRDKNVKRLMLHAGLITILHPFSKQKMTFETKLPIIFGKLLNEK